MDDDVRLRPDGNIASRPAAESLGYRLREGRIPRRELDIIRINSHIGRVAPIKAAHRRAADTVRRPVASGPPA